MATHLPSLPPGLSDVSVPEERYQADFDLLDRYVSFSSELLRLSLAGIATIGFLISALAYQGHLPPILRSDWFVVPATVALVMLALASACALAHRYFASDGMHHHLRALRIAIAARGSDGEHPRAESRDEQARNRQYRRSGRFLIASSCLLALGILAAGVSFTGLLLGTDPMAVAPVSPPPRS